MKLDDITKVVDVKVKEVRDQIRVQLLLKHICEIRLPMYVNMPFTTNITAERTAYTYLA